MHTCPSPFLASIANIRRQNKAVADLLQLHLALNPDLVDWTLDCYSGPASADDLDQWLRSATVAIELNKSHPDWVIPPLPERAPSGAYRHYIPADQVAPRGSCESFVRGWASRFEGQELCWQDREDRRNDIRQTLHERWVKFDAEAGVRWAAIARNHPNSSASKLASRERRWRRKATSLFVHDDNGEEDLKEILDTAAAMPCELTCRMESEQNFAANVGSPALAKVLRNPKRRKLLAYFLNTPNATVGGYAAQTGKQKSQISAELRQVLKVLVGPKHLHLLSNIRAERFMEILPSPVCLGLAQFITTQSSVSTSGRHFSIQTQSICGNH
jgi:hypothetical protein